MSGIDGNIGCESDGFTVSGVTNTSQKKIIVTKCDEIIKLLFHELIHYIGLDLELRNEYDVQWSISPKYILLSEAYTEFLSIILYSVYQSIRISVLTRQSQEKILSQIINTEMKYSYYLSLNIFKIYNVSHILLKDFINGKMPPIVCPVQIWAYIFVRTMMFYDFEYIMNIIIQNDYVLTMNNMNHVLQKMNIFIDDIHSSLKVHEKNLSVSYIAIDMDWS